MRRTIKINNEVLKQMKKIYYPKGKEYLDWMGFPITDINKPSYHHIVKAEDLRREKESDQATISNGAYLGKKSHELLHKIENQDKDLYNSWNDLFLIINKMGIYPIDDVWDMVFNLRKKSFVYEKSNKVYKKTRKN